MAVWRNDSFGNPMAALYVGNAFIGVIQNIVHPGMSTKKKPWRGWFMSDVDGESVGWFETADEARTAVEAAFKMEDA